MHGSFLIIMWIPCRSSMRHSLITLSTSTSELAQHCLGKLQRIPAFCDLRTEIRRYHVTGVVNLVTVQRRVDRPTGYTWFS